MPVFDEIQSRVPVKLWTPLAGVESAALDQLRNVAALPFVFRHVAAMPDVHLGKGATVGSVVATQGAVVPAAVGVDIGCGMMAVRTSLDSRRVRDALPQLRQRIEARIPVGFEGNRRIGAEVENWKGWRHWPGHPKADAALRNKALSQLGSLGGGNHFIEICVDTEDAVWLMLHSGSRNVGKTLAERHINAAKGLMKQMLVNLPDRDLAYLPEGTPEFRDYLRDLDWCQSYAMRNREEMMLRVGEVARHVLGPYTTDISVNCHHNYAAREEHYGAEVIVTRKGAVRAGAGEMGIIPGSMGTRSYIVRGLGNAESFCSCAHGAGRRMSRTAAKKRYTLGDLARQTEGVECRKDKGVLDEIPAAYKDIDEVMANQKDLVEVVATLKQILCVKG